MPKAACCIGTESAPENEGREPARMLKYGESSLHPPKHHFPRPNQGNIMKKLFILLALAAPFAYAGELSCKEGAATDEGITNHWHCTYQGRDLDAAYQAMRQQDLYGIEALPAKLTRRNSTRKWQDSSACDDDGNRDRTVTTIKRTSNSLTVGHLFLGACFNPANTKIHLQRQGGKILIHYQHSAS